MVEKDGPEDIPEVKEKAHFVQQDTIDPIKDPKTGKVFDSKSAYIKHVKSYGGEILGNDLISKEKNCGRNPQDRVTEEKVMDAIEYSTEAHKQPGFTEYFREKEREALDKQLEVIANSKRWFGGS